MKHFTFCAFLLFATGAAAHDGVKNPAVMARMDNMSAIGAAVKKLGDMAKGKSAFDTGKANAAVSQLEEQAGRIVDLFKANEDDPKSEARPEIWTRFSDFSAKANALQTSVSGLGSMNDLSDVRAAMPKIGATCKACHQDYRE